MNTHSMIDNVVLITITPAIAAAVLRTCRNGTLHEPLPVFSRIPSTLVDMQPHIELLLCYYFINFVGYLIYQTWQLNIKLNLRLQLFLILSIKFDCFDLRQLYFYYATTEPRGDVVLWSGRCLVVKSCLSIVQLFPIPVSVQG